MTDKQKPLPPKLSMWVEARKRYKLSHCQIQMARELGMNPKKFGGLANHNQEPWKLPLGQFIEHIYLKTFKKQKPDMVLSIEERHKLEIKKKQGKKKAKAESTQEHSKVFKSE